MIRNGRWNRRNGRNWLCTPPQAGESGLMNANVWAPSICLRAIPLKCRHNGRDGVSNHQPHGCLLNRLFRRRSKKTTKLRVTGLYEGNSPVIGEFPAQRASNAENVSIWWRHHIRAECHVWWLPMYEHPPSASRAPSQYKDRLIYVWRFPC